MRAPVFALLVGLLAVQRIAELVYSHRNASRLRAQGAIEAGREHYPLIVALHVAFYVSLILERMYLISGWPRQWPFWLALLALAELLRAWVLKTLGPRWTTRILVVPGSERIRTGPYRYLRHPNYLAIVLEFLSIPMLAGAYRTALVFSVLNLLVLRIRIREEEKALARWMR
jgi:methyltransferase